MLKIIPQFGPDIPSWLDSEYAFCQEYHVNGSVFLFCLVRGIQFPRVSFFRDDTLHHLIKVMSYSSLYCKFTYFSIYSQIFCEKEAL